MTDEKAIIGAEVVVEENVSISILIFRLGAIRAAFPLNAVAQVFDAVDVGEFPEPPPPGVLGAINVRGLRLPLIDIRTRWGVASKKIELSNQLIVVSCCDTTISIIADEVIGTRSVPLKKIVRLSDILPQKNPHMAVADLDGVLVLLDTDRIFEPAFFDSMNAWVTAVLG
jgi:chemotaxis signal transduction protein